LELNYLKNLNTFNKEEKNDNVESIFSNPKNVLNPSSMIVDKQLIDKSLKTEIKNIINKKSSILNKLSQINNQENNKNLSNLNNYKVILQETDDNLNSNLISNSRSIEIGSNQEEKEFSVNCDKIILDLIDNLYIFHKQKVIILIDDYDTPLNYLNEKLISCYNHNKNSSTFDEVKKALLQTSNLINNFINLITTKNSTKIEKTIITGTYKWLTQDNINNNIKISSMYNDNKFSVCFGFTEKELKEQILSKIAFTSSNFANNEIISSYITDYYNGYMFPNNTNKNDQMKIFNPLSITKYINYFENNNYTQLNPENMINDNSNFNIVPIIGLLNLKNDYFNEIISHNLEGILYNFCLCSQNIPMNFSLNYNDRFNFLKEINRNNNNESILESMLPTILFNLGIITLESFNPIRYRIPNFEIYSYYKKFIQEFIMHKYSNIDNTLMNSFASEMVKNIINNEKDTLKNNFALLFSNGFIFNNFNNSNTSHNNNDYDYTAKIKKDLKIFLIYLINILENIHLFKLEENNKDGSINLLIASKGNDKEKEIKQNDDLEESGDNDGFSICLSIKIIEKEESYNDTDKDCLMDIEEEPIDIYLEELHKKLSKFCEVSKGKSNSKIIVFINLNINRKRLISTNINTVYDNFDFNKINSYSHYKINKVNCYDDLDINQNIDEENLVIEKEEENKEYVYIKEKNYNFPDNINEKLEEFIYKNLYNQIKISKQSIISNNSFLFNNKNTHSFSHQLSIYNNNNILKERNKNIIVGEMVNNVYDYFVVGNGDNSNINSFINYIYNNVNIAEVNERFLIKLYRYVVDSGIVNNIKEEQKNNE
jgi:hypothetical protein